MIRKHFWNLFFMPLFLLHFLPSTAKAGVATWVNDFQHFQELSTGEKKQILRAEFSKRGTQDQNYYKAHEKTLLDLLTKVSVENDHVSFLYKNKTYKVWEVNPGEGTFKLNDVPLNMKMSAEQLASEWAEKSQKVSSFHFFDLIVPDAHAILGPDDIIFTLFALTVMLAVTSFVNSYSLPSLKEQCREMSEMVGKKNLGEVSEKKLTSWLTEAKRIEKLVEERKPSKYSGGDELRNLDQYKIEAKYCLGGLITNLQEALAKKETSQDKSSRDTKLKDDHSSAPKANVIKGTSLK